MKNDFYKFFSNNLAAGKQSYESTACFLTRCFFDAMEKITCDVIDSDFKRRVDSKTLCYDKDGNPILFISEERKDLPGRTYHYSRMKRIKW